MAELDVQPARRAPEVPPELLIQDSQSVQERTEAFPLQLGFSSRLFGQLHEPVAGNATVEDQAHVHIADLVRFAGCETPEHSDLFDDEDTLRVIVHGGDPG